MKKFTLILFVLLFMAGSTRAWGDDGLITGKYWFDNGTETNSFLPGHLEISTDGLADGLHLLNAYVVKDDVMSSTVSRWFVKCPGLTATSSTRILIAVDGRTMEPAVTVPGGDIVQFELDMSSVPEGIHLLDATVMIDNTIASNVSRYFVKTFVPKPGEKYITTVYIDGLPWEISETLAGADGIMSLNLDMSRLPLGLHSLQAQVVSNSGCATDTKFTMFMRVPTTVEMSSLKCYYLLDNSMKGEVEASTDGRIFHVDINAADLVPGLHSVSVYLAGVDGLTTSMQTGWFVKVPLGGEGVKSYEYWLNNNYANIRKVSLDKVENPFNITSLIEVDKEPFSSSRYSFAIEDGCPVVYAQNDFQVRFLDSEGRLSMSSKPFSDVRDKREVTDIVEISGPAEITVPTIGENEIKWYSFNAEAGDSLALRLDRGAMYELWSPEAGLVLRGSGANAVNQKTITLVLNGTYYLAVHDITSYNKTNLKVYLEHIPRLALLRSNPQRAGNKGFVVMDIIGNGFDKLKSLELGNESRTINLDNYTSTRYDLRAILNLDLLELPQGIYDLNATFEDDGEITTVSLSSAIEIVQPGKADVRTEVITPRVAQTPYEFYIDVTNNSTQSAWGVPINIAFVRPDGGVAIEFKDFYTYESDLEEIVYSHIYTDNLLNTGERGVFIPYFIPYIGPNETMRFTIGLTTTPNEHVRTYAWNGVPWSDEFEEILSDGYDFDTINNFQSKNYLSAEALVHLATYVEENPNLNSTKNIIPSKTSYSLKKLRSSGSAAGHATNVAQAAGMAIGGYMNGLSLRNANAYGIDLSDGTYGSLGNYQNDLKRGMPTPGAVVATALGYGDVYGIAQQYLNGCPTASNPMPSPHNVDCYQSGDPNEMHGYISPSGDNYIGKDIKHVEYTIEFENDPEIANASASKIRVDNKLQKDRFDLSTFRPISLKIGSKEMLLPDEHHFTVTMDMRPDISSVAELTFDYNPISGEASWSIRTLDPMTMDETKYMDDGILPVNDGTGRGIGYLTYQVDLLPTLGDGWEINNSATIIFDDNKPIDTPVYTNIIDYTLPESRILAYESEDGQTYNFDVEGTDDGSGIWMYELYVCNDGSGKWNLVKSGIDSDSFTFTSPSPLKGAVFAVLAIDRAGNRQNDDMLHSRLGDADNNGAVDANDVVVTRNYYAGVSQNINKVNADVTRDGIVDAQDATQIRNMYVDKTRINSKKLRSKRKK